MHVGFTGTQIGTKSIEQWNALYFVLKRVLRNNSTFHHGDCIGGDKEAHDIACSLKSLTHIHPPIYDKFRAFCKADFYEEVKPYLDRNKDIVNSTTLLIGLPKSLEEELRSGTWSTIRYGRKNNKQIIIVYPDGNIVKENF